MLVVIGRLAGLAAVMIFGHTGETLRSYEVHGLIHHCVTLSMCRKMAIQECALFECFRVQYSVILLLVLAIRMSGVGLPSPHNLASRLFLIRSCSHVHEQCGSCTADVGRLHWVLW